RSDANFRVSEGEEDRGTRLFSLIHSRPESEIGYVRGVSTRVAVCPGSFDPITLGHVDIVRRARGIADEVIIAIGINPAKTPLIDDETRRDHEAEAAADNPGVRVELVPGLIADFCREVGASAIGKGIRGGADYDAERPQAPMNKHLSGIETVFLTANPELIHNSSSLVRELSKFGRDVSDLVPPQVAAALAKIEG